MDITGLRAWSVRPESKAIETAYPRGSIRTRFYSMVFGSFGSAGSCLGILFPERYRR